MSMQVVTAHSATHLYLDGPLTVEQQQAMAAAFRKATRGNIHAQMASSASGARFMNLRESCAIRLHAEVSKMLAN